jgi:hypothetical protein
MPRFAAGRRSRERCSSLLHLPISGWPNWPLFFPVPLDPDGVRDAATESILVCSDDDPYFPGGAARGVGEPLGIETIVIEGGAHLNPAAGYGEWPLIESIATGI